MFIFNEIQNKVMLEEFRNQHKTMKSQTAYMYGYILYLYIITHIKLDI